MLIVLRFLSFTCTCLSRLPWRVSRGQAPLYRDTATTDCNTMSLHCVVLCVLQNLRANQAPGGGPAADGAALPPGKEPEVTHVTFNKVNGSMGLSIVAAKVSHVFLSQSACVQRGVYCVLLTLEHGSAGT